MARVKELIAQIRTGELVLPEFQRGYVWNRDQVRELVRSLYHGYPSGYLLTWRTMAVTPTRGDEAPRTERVDMLLDGQQRLTSLFGVFEGTPPPFYEGDPARLSFPLMFNIETEAFEFWQPVKMKDDPAWIRVTDFLRLGVNDYLNSGKLSDRTHELALKHLGRLNQLDQIREYEYHVSRIPESLDVETVVEIFNRVNSAGTPLKTHDLALARIGAIWPDGRKTLRDQKAEWETRGWDLEWAMIVRCLAAVTTGETRVGPRFYDLTQNELREAWSKVATAIDRLIEILRRDARLDRDEFLPTVQPLIILVAAMVRSGGDFEDDATRKRFLRWMYLAMLWSRYSGSVDTTLRQDLIALDDPEPVAKLEAYILADRGRLRLDAKALEGRGANTAAFKTARLLMRHLDPRDPFNGKPLFDRDYGASNEAFQASWVFSKDDRRGMTDALTTVQTDEIANRVFVTEKPGRGMRQMPAADRFERSDDLVPGALAAQCFPPDRSLLAPDRIHEFLMRRREIMATEANRILAQLSDLPLGEGGSVYDLIALGEGQTLEFKQTFHFDANNPQYADQKTKQQERMQDVAAAVAGMLNANGGTVLIGVGDDKTIHGVERDLSLITLKHAGTRQDAFENKIRDVLGSWLGPDTLGLIDVAFRPAGAAEIVEIHVDPSDKPVFLDKVMWVRVGNRTLEYSQEQMISYVNEHWPKEGLVGQEQ